MTEAEALHRPSGITLDFDEPTMDLRWNTRSGMLQQCVKVTTYAGGLVAGFRLDWRDIPSVDPDGVDQPTYSEDNCPGHVASDADPKVCARCGVHIDSLRPDDEDN